MRLGLARSSSRPQLTSLGHHGPPCGAAFSCGLLMGRVGTSDRLARRGFPHHDTCPLCDQGEETVNHLLAGCVFAREVWAKVGLIMGMFGLALAQGEDLRAWSI